jgi:hypothetical protein
MKLKLGIVLFLFVLIFNACDTEIDELAKVNEFENQDKHSQDGLIVLGAKLENPFSVTNMQKALDNLIEKGELKSSDISAISATHYYLRFLPDNKSELEQLWDDKGIEIFDYPLDYDIEKEGYFYQDPSIPFGKPTWLYTVVPVGYVFPNIEYEILEECYIPNEENDVFKSVDFNEAYFKLENEAYRLTGNILMDETLKSASGILAGNRPKGKIEVLNTETGNYTGVRGVKVRVRSLVKIDTKYTSTDGSYQMSTSFNNDNIRYDLVYENRNGSKIWGNYAFLNPAVYYLGSQPSSGYDAEIDLSSNAWLWSTVNNAIDLYEMQLCWANGVAVPPYWVEDLDTQG